MKTNPTLTSKEIHQSDYDLFAEEIELINKAISDELLIEFLYEGTFIGQIEIKPIKIIKGDKSVFITGIWGLILDESKRNFELRKMSNIRIIEPEQPPEKYIYYDKNRYMYDRIRWFVFAQDQMTKKQLIEYSKDFGIDSFVNFNALKEELKDEINYALAKHHWYKWSEVIKYTEEFWRAGTLNYNPNWTNTEPYWADYDYVKTIPKFYSFSNSEDNKFYQRLIKYCHSKEGYDGKPIELKRIRPKKPSKLEKIFNEPIYESEDTYIESPSNIIRIVGGFAFFIFFISIFFYDYSFI